MNITQMKWSNDSKILQIPTVIIYLRKTKFRIPSSFDCLYKNANSIALNHENQKWWVSSFFFNFSLYLFSIHSLLIASTILHFVFYAIIFTRTLCINDDWCTFCLSCVVKCNENIIILNLQTFNCTDRSEK